MIIYPINQHQKEKKTMQYYYTMPFDPEKEMDRLKIYEESEDTCEVV